jgi:hypothetical protein
MEFCWLDAPSIMQPSVNEVVGEINPETYGAPLGVGKQRVQHQGVQGAIRALKNGRTDVSKEFVSSILWVDGITDLGKTLAVTSNLTVS